MTHPLLKRSALPFAVPDFAGVTPAQCVEAFKEASANAQKQWDEVAASDAAPTVENTLIPLERATEQLSRVEAVFYTLSGNVGGDDWDEAEQQLVPLFTAHQHAFWTNRALYDRLRALRQTIAADPQDAQGDADAEVAYVLDDYLRDFQRNGISLSAADQQHLRELDEKLGQLEAEFSTRVVKSRTTGAFVLGEGVAATDADGSVDADVIAATAAAPAHIDLVNFTSHPALARLQDPAARRGLLAASLHRADGTGEIDTRPLIVQIAKLRREKARLLGFASYADLAIDESVAPRLGDVTALLGKVAAAAREAVDQQAVRLRELAGADPAGDGALKPGDWEYYEQICRQTDLDLNQADLREYLQLERVVNDGVFYAATRLYGITFHPRTDIKLFDPDIPVWEVHDEGGAVLGLFAADYYRRERKAGGAWMHELVGYNQLAGTRPVVMNSLNIVKPAEGSPTLLTWDEVITCFHEFGHALHGLFAATRLPSHTGTAVPRDYVEFPSQLNEMWAYHPEVAQRFMRHWQTGLPLASDKLDRLVATRTFGQAFQTLEYTAAALVDLAWHTDQPLPEAAQVQDFEQQQLRAAGTAHPLVPPRYSSTYFEHTFGGGYASAYFSYMWAELMVADMEEWIRTGPASGDNQGLNRMVGQILREEILCRGASRDPMVSYRAVTGHDPAPEAVARRRGLA